MSLWLALVPALLAAPPPPVVGGSEVPDGRWGETAGVMVGGDTTCTGVLITPRWVLTAGHCTSNAVDAVYLAGNDLGDLAEGELIEVSQAIPYEAYWDTFDVGLLELSREAKQAPPEVALGCALEDLADGSAAQIVGYGATDDYGTRYTDLLMEATVPITDADCSQANLGCQSAVNPGGELIAGGQGADTCYGDSGGPLFLDTSHGVPALLGITSRGADVEGPPCATGGIYVRVDAIAEWIEETTQQELHRPTCEPAENHPPAPTAETLVVQPGQTASVQIQTGDPDPYDNHTYSLTRDPQLGTAELSAGGLVTYAAPSNSDGVDGLEVRVDDGLLSATVEVLIQIAGDLPDTATPPDSGTEQTGPEACGCASPPSPGNPWGGLVLLVALATRSARRVRRWPGRL